MLNYRKRNIVNYCDICKGFLVLKNRFGNLNECSNDLKIQPLKIGL